MKPKAPLDKLQDEAALRQRNLVYPDTVRNEAEGYRHLLSARRLSGVERSGGFVMGVIFAVLGVGVAFSSFVIPRIAASGSNSRILGLAMIPFALMMTGVGIVFAVLGVKLLKRAFGP